MLDTDEDSHVIEILVHVSAPARAANDATYRQLAQAYLDSRREELRHTSSESNQDAGRTGDGPPVQPRATLSVNSDNTGPASSTPVLVDSQDLSFQSAVDNRSSPRLRTRTRGEKLLSKPVTPKRQRAEEEQAPSPKKWKTPPSQIADSYPLPSPSTTYISPTRILQQYSSRSITATHDASKQSSQGSSSLPRASPRRSPRNDLSQQKQLEPAQASSSRSSLEFSQSADHSEAPTVNSAPSIVPVTPIHGPRITEKQSSTRTRSGKAGQPGFDITHISCTDSSLPPLPSSSRGESEPPPAKAPRTSSFKDPTTRVKNDVLGLVRSSSDIGHAPSASPTSTLSEEQLNALEVFAPSPPVGVEDLDESNMIPENLAKLAAQLSSRYQPVLKRAIDPLERGYWYVDCASWPPERRRAAWVFLFRYIETGMASWGVWCRRSGNHDSLRLYCWGHLVQHAYLLLYLASERALKYTGAEWKDAESEVAIHVPPQERRG
jgi:hypothetical protein